MEYIKDSSTVKKLIAICVITLIVTIVCYILSVITGIRLFFTFFVIFMVTCYHFSMRMIVGAIVTKIYEGKSFNYNAKWFGLSKAESKFYKLIHLKSWKNKLPTLLPDQFDLSQRSLDEILFYMTQGEIIHEIIVVLSFVPVFFTFIFGVFWAFFITSLLAALIESLFVMLQRFNRARVLKLRETLKKRKTRKR